MNNFNNIKTHNDNNITILYNSVTADQNKFND